MTPHPLEVLRQSALGGLARVRTFRRVDVPLRSMADRDHRTAEYAVLVTDRWQGRGLGALLTEYCLDLAPVWGVKEIVAYTTAVNGRALSIFRKLGFQIERKDGWQEIEVRKTFS